MNEKEVRIIQNIMTDNHTSFKNARLCYEYPDLKLSKKVKHYQTNPY